MTQILANTPTTLEWLVYVDGTLTDLEAAPAPAVSAVNGNGATVTLGAVSNPSTGTYQATLDAGDPTIVAASLTGELATDRSYAPPARLFEIVGGLLFTEAQVRAFKGAAGQTPLSSTSEYSDEFLADLREEVLDGFAEETGRSWVPRYCRAEFTGSGTRSLYLPDGVRRTAAGVPIDTKGLTRDVRRVLSASIDGTAVTVSDLVIDGSWVHHKTGTWTRGSSPDPLNVVVEWEAGVTPTAAVSNLALETAVAWGVHSSISPFATSMTTGDGTSHQFGDGRVYPNRVWRWLRRNDLRVAIA